MQGHIPPKSPHDLEDFTVDDFLDLELTGIDSGQELEAEADISAAERRHICTERRRKIEDTLALWKLREEIGIYDDSLDY